MHFDVTIPYCALLRTVERTIDSRVIAVVPEPPLQSTPLAPVALWITKPSRDTLIDMPMLASLTPGPVADGEIVGWPIPTALTEKLVVVVWIEMFSAYVPEKTTTFLP